MYAIISAGGKQYKVTPGMLLDVELIKEDVGKTVRLDQVLAVRKESQFHVGHPVVKGAAVKAEVLDHPKGEKVINYRYKRRKRYHRKVGHRQCLTRLKIVEITLNGAH